MEKKSKAVYKLYKKTGKMVRGAFPKLLVLHTSPHLEISNGYYPYTIPFVHLHHGATYISLYPYYSIEIISRL